jgi:CRP/FNR family transcriptional regulator, cyclic AMP receptor protein
LSVVALAELGRTEARVRAPHAVALTRLDPAFDAAVPADQRARAARFTADVHLLRPGPWAADESDTQGRRRFAALVLSGLLCQEVSLAGRPSAELLGPGDVVRPWQSDDQSIPCHLHWTCINTASVAILDQRFVAAARRWPALMTVIFERLADQLHNAQRRAVITGLPRVEQRLVALFWQLADRWGLVRPEGIVIGLKLTHEFLGRLIAARRSTVSLALGALAADGLLTRDEVGCWTLAPRSAEVLQPALDRYEHAQRFRRGSEPLTALSAGHRDVSR